MVKEDPRRDGDSAESMALSASVFLVQDQAFPLSLPVKRSLNSEAALVCPDYVRSHLFAPSTEKLYSEHTNLCSSCRPTCHKVACHWPRLHDIRSLGGSQPENSFLSTKAAA